MRPIRPRNLLSCLLLFALLLTSLASPGFALPSAPQGPQLHWQWRSPSPQGNDLQSVVYSGDKFVAVGDKGTVVTSTAGNTSWTLQTSGTTADLKGVAYGGGQYVAVGDKGTVITSSDGVTWRPASFPTSDNLSSVAYGSLGWVASATAQNVWTSADGQTWEPQRVSKTAPFTSLSGVTYAGNQIVAWGYPSDTMQPTAFVSTDGVKFVAKSPNMGNPNTASIAYDSASGRLLGIDTGGHVFIQTDLVNWQNWRDTVLLQYRSVAFGGGYTVAVGGSPDQGMSATLTDDPRLGTYWTTGTPPSAQLNGITYGAGLFVAVGGSGNILTSTDGSNWTKQVGPLTDPRGELSNIVYDGKQFVATASNHSTSTATLITSTDGSTWVSWTPGPRDTPLPYNIEFLTYAGGQYVGFAQGQFCKASDPQKWQYNNPGGIPIEGFNPKGIAYNGTTYVVSDVHVPIAYSTDAVSWTAATVPDSPQPKSLMYAGGHFAFVTTSGAIVTSSDGINWTLATWPSPAAQPASYFMSIVYDGHQFLAAGTGGTVATSTDGVNWTAHTTNVSDTFGYVAYGGGLFTAMAGGQLWASTDGLTWTPQQNLLASPTGLVYGGGVWVEWQNSRPAAIVSAQQPAASAPPAAPALPPVTITAPAAGLYTNNNLYTFKGNVLVPGSTVTVTIDGTTAGTVKLDATSAQWSFTPAAPLADGPHTVTASANGYITAGIPFTVKTKPPLLTVTLPGGGITNQNKPTITGTTEAGVTVSRDGNAIATLTPDGSGSWSYTFPSTLPDGTYSLTFTATDLAGNVTTLTKPLKIKTTIPAIAITPPAGPASVSQPVVAGTAEAGSTVAVYVGGGWAATATADSSGAWSATLPALVDGSYWLTASATDAAGNVGLAPGISLRVATAAQPVAITAPASGSATNQAQPAIAGTAKAGSTVNVTLDGKQAATVTADSRGRWQVTPAAPLADGSHTVSAAATDPAGTASTTGTVTFTVKTSMPGITLTLPSGNLTTPLAPAGSAEAGSTVRIYLDGTLAATVQPDASGAWTASIPAADGSHTVSATATDAAGNVGKAPALTVQVVPAVAVSTPDGAHFTTAQPALAGTAQPGSTVWVVLDGTPWGSVTARANGGWSYTPTVLADGSHTVSATATDAQGVTGTSSTHHFTVNTTPVALTDIVGNPAADAITSLVQQGIFTGFPDGTFRPDLGLTRAQLAVVYAKALGLQPQPVAALTFNDRSEIGDWAAPYVAAMLQQGLLKGYPDGSFRPNATISRAELASLLARLLQQRGIKVQGAAPVITDQLPAWAADAIRTAAAAGLLTPAPDGTFNPAAPATRGETAQAFYTLLTLLQGR